MPSLPRFWPLLLCGVLCTPLSAQKLLPAGETRLTTPADFLPTKANWSVAGGVAGDPRREKVLVKANGSGVLLNIPGGENKGNLVTAWEHGDLQFDCEFLVPVGANSGIYFMGRYEVQLFDSWGVSPVKFTDSGAIYERWDEKRAAGQEGYEGIAPRANASRAPGLWQTLHVEFRAPRFDAAGKKVENAQFLKVELNGFTVQENVEVTGPTRSSLYRTEGATGPIEIQGDHGSIAFRGIRCRALPDAPPVAKAGPNRAKPSKTLVIEPASRVRLQRGFVPFLPSKRLYACSVGTPSGIHFAYDFETGAILQVWRGSFLDTSEMWQGRGNDQTARPAGPVLTLNAKPAVAFIEYPDKDGWPDQANALYSSNGYRLEADGTPMFLSTLSGLNIAERIVPAPERHGLTCTLTFEGSLASWLAFALLAEDEMITPVAGGYLIGDRHWYLDWPAESLHEPVIRNHGGKQQLVVPLTKNSISKPVVYTLVW